jgi:hypothetical protein
MNWEVIHYWLLVEDDYGGYKRQEWVQFVVHTKPFKHVHQCRVLVRADTNGAPGKILSTWTGTVEHARQLWDHYMTKQNGRYLIQKTERRNDQSYTPTK